MEDIYVRRKDFKVSLMPLDRRVIGFSAGYFQPFSAERWKATKAT